MSIVRGTSSNTFEQIAGMYDDGVIQDILQILGLDVDTFNASTEYKVNDFVVREHMLWRCIEATTGAWSEAKWVKDSVLVPSE